MLFVRIIEAELGLKVVKEYQFHPTRKWRFDYAIPEYKIAIEVEGGTFKETYYQDKKTGEIKTHVGGRHNTGKGFIADLEKYNTAVCQGWSLLRITPEQLISNIPITNILNILKHNSLLKE